MLRSLNQIGRECIAQQHGDGSCHAEVADAEGLAVGGDAEHDVLDTPLQVFLARRQTEDGHQFRGWCDVEARFRDHSVTSQSRHHIAQGTVVHVEHPLPVDLPQ